MDIRSINNHFGDMDLFLMDAILKGIVSPNDRVLDLGCGEGRNGIYFIREGHSYLGIDEDSSRIQMIEYLSKTLADSKAEFQIESIQAFQSKSSFDLVICSRVLHFAKNSSDFRIMWKAITNHLAPSGIIYASMDSAIDNTLAEPLDLGLVEFPDGKTRFALTDDLYSEIKKGFEEIEPLRTVAHHRERAQSFMLLRKI